MATTPARPRRRCLAAIGYGVLLGIAAGAVPARGPTPVPGPPSQPMMPELAGEPLALEELERCTLEHNPEILQAEAAIRAAAALRRQVGLYPNPLLGLAVEEIAMESGRDTGKVGGFLAQTIVTGGKLGLNRKIFAQEVERAEAAAELARLREINRVRVLYYRTVAAQRLVELRRQLAELAHEAVATTTELFNTGAADRPDQLAITIEAEKAELDVGEARRRLRQLWGQLTAAVGDPVLEPRRLEDRLETDPPVLDVDATLQRILEESPETRFARAGIVRAELALRREKVVPLPDIELTAGIMDNREPLAPGGPEIGSELFGDVGIRIPLFDRNQGNVAAAEAELERARDELRKTRLKLEARFAPVFADYSHEVDTVSRYRERILAQSEEAYRLYLERYRQMAAAYPQVLISQRTLFQARADYVMALTRLWEAAVLLDGMLLIDEPVPAILDDAVVRRTPLEATGR